MPNFSLSGTGAVRPAIVRYILISAIVAITQQVVFASQSVTLRWDPSGSPGVAGYHVYYGTESGNYFPKVFVTTDTSTRVTGLQEGTTYYFVVTAYDETGIESEPSNEVAYTVPLPALQISRISSGEFSKAFSLAAGSSTFGQWALEASEDLRTWRTLVSGTNSVASAAVLVTPHPALFFRLKSPSPGVRLATKSLTANGFPNSFFITPAGATPSQWVLETSRDLRRWTPFTAGTNSPLNVAVVPSTAPKMFFRLKFQ